MERSIFIIIRNIYYSLKECYCPVKFLPKKQVWNATWLTLIGVPFFYLLYDSGKREGQDPFVAKSVTITFLVFYVMAIFCFILGKYREKYEKQMCDSFQMKIYESPRKLGPEEVLKNDTRAGIFKLTESNIEQRANVLWEYRWAISSYQAPIRLVREAENKDNPFAVSVYWGKVKLGYLPQFCARVLTPAIDKGLNLKTVADVINRYEMRAPDKYAGNYSYKVFSETNSSEYFGAWEYNTFSSEDMQNKFENDCELYSKGKLVYRISSKEREKWIVDLGVYIHIQGKTEKDQKILQDALNEIEKSI